MSTGLISRTCRYLIKLLLFKSEDKMVMSGTFSMMSNRLYSQCGMEYDQSLQIHTIPFCSNSGSVNS